MHYIKLKKKERIAMVTYYTIIEKTILKSIKELALFNKYGANKDMLIKIIYSENQNINDNINNILDSMIINKKLIKKSITLDNTDFCY